MFTNQKSTEGGGGAGTFCACPHMPSKVRERRNHQLGMLPTPRLEALRWPDEETEAARLPMCLAAWEGGHPQCGGHGKPERKIVLSGQAGLLLAPTAKQRSQEGRGGERGEERTGQGRKSSGLDPGLVLSPITTPAQVLGKRTTTHPSRNSPEMGSALSFRPNAWRACVQPEIKEVGVKLR